MSLHTNPPKDLKRDFLDTFVLNELHTLFLQLLFRTQFVHAGVKGFTRSLSMLNIFQNTKQRQSKTKQHCNVKKCLSPTRFIQLASDVPVTFSISMWKCSQTRIQKPAKGTLSIFPFHQSLVVSHPTCFVPKRENSEKPLKKHKNNQNNQSSIKLIKLFFEASESAESEICRILRQVPLLSELPLRPDPSCENPKNLLQLWGLWMIQLNL